MTGPSIPNSTSCSNSTLRNAHEITVGQHSVVVSNGFGSITSSLASLTVNFGLTVTATTGGVVTKSPDQPNYVAGTSVTLTALAVWPYSFSGWSGGISGTNNPRTILMTSNLAVVAQFTSNIPDLIIDNPQ